LNSPDAQFTFPEEREPQSASGSIVMADMGDSYNFVNYLDFDYPSNLDQSSIRNATMPVIPEETDS
jgi:hypothetical protein